MEKNRNANSQHLRWVAIFCLVAVGLIALGIFYYRYEAQLIEDDKYEDISVIAKLKANSIQDWRKQRLADVKRVAVGPLVRKEIARFLHDPTNPSARAALQIQLNINRKNNVYADALFLDTNGNILLADNPNPVPVDQATMKAIGIALKDRKEKLSDFFRDPKGIIYIDTVAPIPDNSGQPIAIMILRSKADDFLYPLIRTWPTSSETGETLLVRRDGDSVLFLNELRHKSNTALNLRIPLTNKTLPAVQTVSGKYNRLHGKDYRGVDVLAIGQPILQSPWFIVSKVDEKEILAEVRYRAWVIFIIVALLVLIAAGIISLIHRNQREVERKQADEMLLKSEAFYRSLFDNMAEGFAYCRMIFENGKPQDFIYLAVNNAFETLTGLRNVTGKKVSEVIPGIREADPQLFDIYARVSLTGKPERFEIFVEALKMWFSLSVYGPEKEHFVAVFDVITEHKKVEEEISTLNAELEQRVIDRTVQIEAANKELVSFAYSVSHDLRAPLRGIDGWCLALLEDYNDKLDEQGRHYLERVRWETQLMGQLIDDLLMFSRQSSVEMNQQRLDMTGMVQDIVVRLLQQNPTLQADFIIQPGLTAIGDSSLIGIALKNLLDNALKFSSKSSRAVIEFGQIEQDGEKAFFVRDNGVGFDMEYAHKLFGVFQRLHKLSEFPGTGIGLATVQRIIHRHGGRIWAEAKIDEGATFYFTLKEAT